MMNNLVPRKNYWLLLFGVAALLILTGIAPNLANNLPKEEKQAVKVINERDIQRVEMNTEGFLNYFVGGFPLDQQLLTDITFEYFSPRFLENEFSDRKSELFGWYGFDTLMNISIQKENGEKGMKGNQN